MKISRGWKREGVSPKCLFTLVKGKSFDVDQFLFLEEFEGGFIELNIKKNIENTQKEI